jgi:hypothetical protein
MLQSLAEKESTYTHKWQLRRIVFEPNHRYFFYSDVLDHQIKETKEIQQAIAECRDLHTTWKHKIKVTKVLRDIQLHHPPSEATLQTEDFDVRAFYILHVEGYRRKINTVDKFTTALHAAFDEASPVRTNTKKGNAINSAFEKKIAEAIHHELAAEDELSLSYNDHNSIPTRYTFRFLSQAVFTQWFEAFTAALERDEVAETKYSVDCPKVDPRCNVPIARVPLHLTNTMHVLDQFIFYALLRGTRIVLNEREHDPHNYSAVSLGEVDHLHLLRYEDAARYHDPTFLLLTDNVVYFVRKDGKVIWTLNLIDVEAVWFNTTATPEPFIVFKNRPPLADLVFLVFNDPQRRGPVGYYDSTLHGTVGAKFFVDVLLRLAPHAAAVRARGEKAVQSAPALRQKLAEAPLKDGVQPSPQLTAPFQCIGMNIYGTFEEFVREEAPNIAWRSNPDVVSTVTTGRASAMPHVQVAPTPRWKLTKALQDRAKLLAKSAAAAKLHDAALAAKASSEAAAASRTPFTSPPPSPPPKALLALSPHHAGSPVLAHPHAEKMPKIALDHNDDVYDEVVDDRNDGAAATSVPKLDIPPPPPKRSTLATRGVTSVTVEHTVGLAESPGTTALQRKQSNISKVVLTPLQLPSDVSSRLGAGSHNKALSEAQIPAPQSNEDLLGLFSPKLLPRSQQQPLHSNHPTGAATEEEGEGGQEFDDGIVLEDSFDEEHIDDDDL